MHPTSTHALLRSTFTTGCLSIFYPAVWFASLGPIKPLFDTAATPELLLALRFAGGLLLFMAPVLFVVRWNKINGKAGALGMWMAAANTAYIALSMDAFTFVPRAWWLFVVVFFCAGLHLAFNANEMLTVKDLEEKAAKKKAKAKAKGN